MMVVGVVLVVIGVALMYVPLSPQPNQQVWYTEPRGDQGYVGSVSGWSITGSIPVAVSWSANGSTSVSVLAGTCSGNCSNGQVSDVTYQNGTSGSFTLNQPNGGSVAMGVLSFNGAAESVTFKITTALTTVGAGLLILGIILVIVGLVVRSKRKSAPEAAPPPTPTGTPAETAPPAPPT